MNYTPILLTSFLAFAPLESQSKLVEENDVFNKVLNSQVVAEPSIGARLFFQKAAQNIPLPPAREERNRYINQLIQKIDTTIRELESERGNLFAGRDDLSNLDIDTLQWGKRLVIFMVGLNKKNNPPVHPPVSPVKNKKPALQAIIGSVPPKHDNKLIKSAITASINHVLFRSKPKVEEKKSEANSVD